MKYLTMIEIGQLLKKIIATKNTVVPYVNLPSEMATAIIIGKAYSCLF